MHFVGWLLLLVAGAPSDAGRRASGPARAFWDGLSFLLVSSPRLSARLPREENDSSSASSWGPHPLKIWVSGNLSGVPARSVLKCTLRIQKPRKLRLTRRQGGPVRIELGSGFTRSVRRSGLGLCDLRVVATCWPLGRADFGSGRSSAWRTSDGVAFAMGCALQAVVTVSADLATMWTPKSRRRGRPNRRDVDAQIAHVDTWIARVDAQIPHVDT